MLPRPTVYPEDFISIDDDISNLYKEVIQDHYYRYKLPSSMLDGGLCIMQERQPLPVKNTPLYSEIKKTCYGKNIEFFTNNLPSFKQYREQDEITWVVTEHRRLVTEILDFYRDKEPSLSTLEYRIKGMLYIIKLAYGRKTTPLYALFSQIVYQLHYI